MIESSREVVSVSSYFKSEPFSFYIIESYDQFSTWKDVVRTQEYPLANNEIRSTTASILLDCKLETKRGQNSLLKKNKSEIKWIKNDAIIDFNAKLINSVSDEEINR